MKYYRYSGSATLNWTSIAILRENKSFNIDALYKEYGVKNVEMKWLDEDNDAIDGYKINIESEYSIYKNKIFF